MGFYFNTNSITPSGGSGGSGGTINWGNIGGILTDQTDLNTELSNKANTASLATVATSGSYADLSNKPTIPTITDTYSRTSSDGMSGKAVASAIDGVLSTVYIPVGSTAFENLPTPSSRYLGNVVNVTNDFTTTSDFVEGAGKSYPAGTNVVCVRTGTQEVYKWDALAGFIDLSGYQQTSTAVTHTTSTAVGSVTQPVYIASDGTATAVTYELNKTVPADAVFTDTTYSEFVGATYSIAGSAGLVPAPTINDVDSYLKGDGTWQSGIVINNATSGNLAIGPYTKASNFNTVAYGITAQASGMFALALGYYATAKNSYTIQLGQGTNNTANTFQVTSYTLLNTSTGKIPNDRVDGVSGSFTTADSKTVTVTNGVITSIV